jgi:hypothetical protein
MTTNQYQSEVVNAFAVFAKVIIATATERAALHAAGIHVCVEMLTDGLCISHQHPNTIDLECWQQLRQVLLKIQDILWHEGNFTCKSQHKQHHDIHTYICNGTWDIQWPELNETGAITYDNGGQQQWN